jgi:hypothetical protein
MSNDHLKLKAVTDINQSHLMNDLEQNLKFFLQWGLLQAAAWSDVSIPKSTGFYGGNYYTLAHVADPNYTDGQIWETPRLDLVYESGVNYDGSINPIAISGVYIDGTFYGPDHATYGHYVDYPRGRVVFNNAISTDATVTMEYSYRDIQVELADNSIVWKQIQKDSFRVDSGQLGNSEEGEWTAKLSDTRQQLPAIIIEVVPQGYTTPYEIGNGSLERHQDVLFHVIAEDRYWRNQLCDILIFQQDKTIYMFNTNEVAESGAFPLDYRGTIVNGGLCYPDLVKERRNGGYRWRKLTFERVTLSEVENINPNLYRGTVRATMGLVYGNI